MHLFYRLIKILAAFGELFFFRRKTNSGFDLRELKGPAIIASNHPNSMMDAILIATRCTQPVHFMVRSDMFNRPLFRKFLLSLNGIPIFRLSEEKNKLRENFNTIRDCINILNSNGIIIIFHDGVTLHDWRLKPPKSGLAKIISHAKEYPELIKKLQIVPFGITYNNFDSLYKTVILESGLPFSPNLIEPEISSGLWQKTFNELLFRKLVPLVPEMKSTDRKIISTWQRIITYHSTDLDSLHKIGTTLSKPNLSDQEFTKIVHDSLPNRHKRFWSLFKFASLLPFAIAGILLNGLFYFPLRSWIKKITRGSIFLDSVSFGIMSFIYPPFCIVESAILNHYLVYHFVLWFLLIPLSAWLSFECGYQFRKFVSNQF